MNTIRSMLSDRRRSQRGSVLSGVLIITLFLGIISGALMTALSTDFLLSGNLAHRMTTEATVRSAAELALDQLQNTPLGPQCPSALPSASLNGQVATSSYISCLQRRVLAVPSSYPFGVDGTRAIRSGADEYLVGDSNGTVFGYTFGSTNGWSLPLGGSVTGPPMGMLDSGGDPLDFVPAADPTAAPGVGVGCSSYCVALVAEGSPPYQPALQCYLPSYGRVAAAPAAGLANPNLVFFGDSGGVLYAYYATGGSQCLQQTRVTTGYGAVVAGPIVFRNGTRDEVFVVVDGSPGRIVHYTFSGGSFSDADSLKLPASGPQGIAVEAAWPARVAITFASGTVAIVQIDSTFNSSAQATASVGSGFSDAPFWCQCPGGNVIGAGSTNGTLYLLDVTLSSVGSYTSGSPIRTTPAADAAGDWFFGADDGYLREVRNRTMSLAAKLGPLGGGIGSSAIVGQCSIGVCVYLGSQNISGHVVPIDAREAVLTSCISISLPDCSGQDPRLWTQVEVDSATTPEAVHVQGWSYYSP